MEYRKYRQKSKAKLLHLIQAEKLIFNVPNLISFSAINFEQVSSEIIYKISNEFTSRKIAIRSSAADEDGCYKSSAGEYTSVLNVFSDNKKEIIAAINTVILSYKKKRSVRPEDEIIVQEMLQDTIMSGVIFTHDLNTGAPYYVINYDDQSGLTDTVTSGESEYANRTLYVHRNSVNKLHSERFIKLLTAVQELEKTMNSQFLDIEFALDADLNPYLLQVRTITTQPNWNRAVVKRIDATLQGVQSFITERFKKLKGVYGKNTILGQMPDWNPVEMIGRAPRALATSIYQILITDHVWSSARSMMGYSTPTGQPLMVTLAGQPFIDTRLSFNSYLPQAVSPVIAEKLVNHWVNQLKSSPELHDKVEFEVAITTYSFDIDEKMERLVGDVLTDGEKVEFKEAHLEQTRELIKGNGSGSINSALDKINILNIKQNEVSNSGLSNNISSLYTMVEECIQYGTIPFSILARHGFIARTILLSLYHQGIITNNEISQIHASVQTVASDLVDDMRSLQTGKMSNTEFMALYGHLRPGTYDIMSRRYDQMKDLSIGTTPSCIGQKRESFQLSIKQKKQINRLLEECSFTDFKADDLLNYIRNAIVGREYGKFIFTRSVSNILELIANFAEINGLSRDEVSHVPIDTILNVMKSSSEISIEKQLRNVSEQEEEKHHISVSIHLPQLLIDQAGVHIIPFQVSHPNFITHKKVTAVQLLIKSKIDGLSLSGKVVIIENADPGFDWIFSQKIAGLITKYGGANSHMAIRCAEFGIPAAIGCGEQRFDMLLRSNKVHLDCASGLVSPVH